MKLRPSMRLAVLAICLTACDDQVPPSAPGGSGLALSAVVEVTGEPIPSDRGPRDDPHWGGRLRL